jgi:hypothetical protein
MTVSPSRPRPEIDSNLDSNLVRPQFQGILLHGKAEKQRRRSNLGLRKAMAIGHSELRHSIQDRGKERSFSGFTTRSTRETIEIMWRSSDGSTPTCVASISLLSRLLEADVPPSIDTPAHLTLLEEPKANVNRYDHLRGHGHVG